MLGLLQWIPHWPPPHPPHCCQSTSKKIQSVFSCSKSFSAPSGLILCEGSGPLLRISGAPQGGEKCMYCLKPALTLRITQELFSLHWFSQLALASTRLTSYSLLFLPSCFGCTELFEVSHTLPAVSHFCALFMLFPLPGLLLNFSHLTSSYSFMYSAEASSLLQFSKPFQADTGIYTFLTFLNPPVQCFIVL